VNAVVRVVFHFSTSGVPLTDNAMKLIGGRCTELSAIELPGNVRVTDKGIAFLLKGCALTLKRMNLAGCTQVLAEGRIMRAV
jgi:hypothetical protein